MALLLIVKINSFFALDINECELNEHQCDHTCINTDGSYYCECNTGYYLDDDDGFRCIGTTTTCIGLSIHINSYCTSDYWYFKSREGMFWED